ncbi:hypothetical protein ACTFIZ_001979 [Dictyostelium cf. discoideum]
MKMKYPEYNYQKDPWSKINKFLDSINIIKKDKNKNNKNKNQNNNINNNKTVLTEFCNNNCKINNSNNGDNSFHSFNDNYYQQEQQQQQQQQQQQLQQQQLQQQQYYYQQQYQNHLMGNIDITKDSPNSQKYYLEQSPNRQDDRIDYWFKQPEDWEINLKILYQLKWRKQMTPCFKRYKIKTREKITYDHFKISKKWYNFISLVYNRIVVNVDFCYYMHQDYTLLTMHQNVSNENSEIIS